MIFFHLFHISKHGMTGRRSALSAVVPRAWSGLCGASDLKQKTTRATKVDRGVGVLACCSPTSARRPK